MGAPPISLLQVPDIYDSAKYDSLHNSHLNLTSLSVSGLRGGLGLVCKLNAERGLHRQGLHGQPAVSACCCCWAVITAESYKEAHGGCPHPPALPPCPLKPQTVFVLLQDLYQVSRQLAAVVVPHEYGLNGSGKLLIGSKICAELLGKLMCDLDSMKVSKREGEGGKGTCT